MNYKIGIGIVGLIIIVIITMTFFSYCNQITHYIVIQGEKPTVNPLKGWATLAENSEVDQKVTLAFMLVKWSDLEKEKGVYDFDKLETLNHFEEWSNKGARIILRLVSDYPDLENQENINIPRWLYDEIGGDGQWYHNSYGYGFSPNYANKKFIAAHETLIKAIGERYNQEELVAYVQLGSIGHWGEWHINHDEDIKETLPLSAVTDQYVRHYLNYLDTKKLLMRRPYQIAVDYKLGVYHDNFGNIEATEEWQSWIDKGYTSSQNKEVLPQMEKEFWHQAPVGGEMASNETLETYFSTYFDIVYKQIISSHASFIGPNAPVYIEEESRYQPNLDKITQNMGYCLTVTRTSVKRKKNEDIEVMMEWENIGNAPIYQNWPVRISIIDETGRISAETSLEEDISTWIPGHYNVEVTFPNTAQIEVGHYKLCAAILDPVTMTPSVKLAVKNEYDTCQYIVGEFEVK